MGAAVEAHILQAVRQGLKRSHTGQHLWVGAAHLFGRQKSRRQVAFVVLAYERVRRGKVKNRVAVGRGQALALPPKAVDNGKLVGLGKGGFVFYAKHGQCLQRVGGGFCRARGGCRLLRGPLHQTFGNQLIVSVYHRTFSAHNVHFGALIGFKTEVMVQVFFVEIE